MIRVLVNGKLRAQPFLDIRSLVRSGGEQGLLSVAFHPNYAKQPPLLRRLHRRERRHARRRVPLERHRRRCRTTAQPAAVRRAAVRQPQRRPAPVRPRRAALRRHGRRRLGRRPGQPRAEPEHPARQALRLNVDKRGARWQVAGYGLRNPWRFSFDRATATSTSATSARTRWEEVDVRTPRAAARAEQLRLARLGGPLALHARPAGEPARRARLPDRRLQPLARAARSRAATSTAAGRSSRLAAATSTATTAAARSGACARRRASCVGGRGASRSRSRTSRRSARTRPASSTRPRSTARSTSSRASRFARRRTCGPC